MAIARFPDAEETADHHFSFCPQAISMKIRLSGYTFPVYTCRSENGIYLSGILLLTDHNLRQRELKLIKHAGDRVPSAGFPKSHSHIQPFRVDIVFEDPQSRPAGA